MNQINQFLWGKEMILLLLGISLYFMLRTHFVLYRHPLRMLKTLRNSDGLSSLWNALASSLGVGSVSGVASALALGGSGALVWMMISAIFGMMLKYVEILAGLSVQQKYRHQFMGGCMMIFHHTRLSFLGVFFAICCIGASFGIGNLVPMQAMKDVVFTQIDMPLPCIAMAFGIVLWICLSGGGKRIIRLNEALVPLACVCYVGACIYLLIPHFMEIPLILKEAFVQALSWRQVGSGVGGYVMMNAMRYGMARGVFSHEAGMGSSPLAYTSHAHNNHHQVALLGVVEVFFDTLVVCFLSALVLLCSHTMHLNLQGSEWMYQCFVNGFGYCGGLIFACIILLFAFPCMFGWFRYGMICCVYLSSSPLLLTFYRIAFVGISFLSFFQTFPGIFTFCDMMNGLMMIPNLISLLILRKSVIKCIKDSFN